MAEKMTDEALVLAIEKYRTQHPRHVDMRMHGDNSPLERLVTEQPGMEIIDNLLVRIRQQIGTPGYKMKSLPRRKAAEEILKLNNDPHLTSSIH